MTLRDKRLGVGTERRYGFTAALSGCAPLSNVPVSSLGTPTPLVRSLKGLHSRRDSALQVVARSYEHAGRYVGEAAQRALTCGTRANGLSTMKRLADDTGTRKMNRSGN